jgi:hypothetical protein
MGKWDKGNHNRTLLADRRFRDGGKVVVFEVVVFGAWSDGETRVKVVRPSEQNCSFLPICPSRQRVRHCSGQAEFTSRSKRRHCLPDTLDR